MEETNRHIEGSDICVICGRDIPEGSQYCIECGKIFIDDKEVVYEI